MSLLKDATILYYAGSGTRWKLVVAPPPPMGKLDTSPDEYEMVGFVNSPPHHSGLLNLHAASYFDIELIHYFPDLSSQSEYIAQNEGYADFVIPSRHTHPQGHNASFVRVSNVNVNTTQVDRSVPGTIAIIKVTEYIEFLEDTPPFPDNIHDTDTYPWTDGYSANPYYVAEENRIVASYYYLLPSDVTFLLESTWSIFRHINCILGYFSVWGFDLYSQNGGFTTYSHYSCTNHTPTSTTVCPNCGRENQDGEFTSSIRGVEYTEGIDIGLRAQYGFAPVGILCAPGEHANYPLRIYKDGEVYSILDETPGSPAASSILYHNGSEIRALRRVT